MIFCIKQNAGVGKRRAHKGRATRKACGLVQYIREVVQDQLGSHFFDHLVELDDLPRKLVGDLDGYEELGGINFRN